MDGTSEVGADFIRAAGSSSDSAGLLDMVGACYSEQESLGSCLCRKTRCDSFFQPQATLGGPSTEAAWPGSPFKARKP